MVEITQVAHRGGAGESDSRLTTKEKEIYDILRGLLVRRDGLSV